MSAPAVAPPVDEAPPRRRRGRLLLVLALVAVLVGGGTAAWLLLGPADDADVEVAEVADGPIVALESQTTTLGGEGLLHARIGIAVVLADGQDPAVIDDRAPLLQDALVAELAAVSGDELRGAEGAAALRGAMSEHAVRIWGEDVVRRAVLTELLVQ